MPLADGDINHHRNLSTCHGCALRPRSTTENVKRVKRWKHESVIDAMQRRLDLLPNAMGIRRRTVEHVFGTRKTGNPDWLMSDFERACKLMTSASAIIAPDRVVRSQDPNSPAICESVWKPSPTCFRMAASAPWLSPDMISVVIVR